MSSDGARDMLALIGAGSVVGGLWLIHLSAALIGAGALLIVVAVLLRRL